MILIGALRFTATPDDAIKFVRELVAAVDELREGAR
jgi:hypothetical protein